MTSKYLTTICLILGSIIPIIVDTGHTHLFNVDWDEHSRVHEVWRLVTNLSIAVVGLYILYLLCVWTRVFSALVSSGAS